MAINFKTDDQWNREAKRAAEHIGAKIREAHRDYLVAKEEASDKKKAWAALVVELQETVEYYSRYGPGKENPPPRQGTVDDLDDHYREPAPKPRKAATQEPLTVIPQETTVNVEPTPATAKPLEAEPTEFHGIPFTEPEKPGDPFAVLRGIPLNEFEQYGCPKEVIEILTVGKVKQKGKTRGFHEPLTNYGELLNFRQHMTEYKLTDFHGIGEESAALFERAEQLFLLDWEKGLHGNEPRSGNTGQGDESNSGEHGGDGSGVPGTGSEAPATGTTEPEPPKKKRGRPAKAKEAEVS